MFAEAQGSIVQGFSNALTDSFADSKVIKSMQNTFTSVFESSRLKEDS